MEPSDADLVARFVATRDEAAFGALVVRHQGRVRNWLRQLVRDRTRADDLAQDAFIRAWERIGGLRDPAKFSSWLMSIAYTTFLQARRKRGSDDRMLEAVKREPGPTSSPEPGDAESDLPKLLAVLSDDERAAMTLCYAQGMSHSEITEVTGWPLGSVKSHIARGKAKIRERFGISDET
jgi:RNA polymerase sigma-70 factor (ECF subfamily)